MDLSTFREVESRLALGGYYESDLRWAENVGPPRDADAFAREAVFVVCNSGMRFTVATTIFRRCMAALEEGRSASTAFGHVGKSAAMDAIWRDRSSLLDAFLAAADGLAFLETLPWIGGITKYHLAKNLGMDVVKPDVHMTRLASAYGTDPTSLCAKLAEATGYRVGTVDVLLWRACATGVVDSRTATFRQSKSNVAEPPSST